MAKLETKIFVVFSHIEKPADFPSGLTLPQQGDKVFINGVGGTVNHKTYKFEGNSLSITIYVDTWK